MKKYEPDEEKLKLLLRKGVYPYEYMDSWERFTIKRLNSLANSMIQE